ncbi:MAG: hypothetical protein ACLQDV_24900 [Candidatus Binataceae bacterium]
MATVRKPHRDLTLILILIVALIDGILIAIVRVRSIQDMGLDLNVRPPHQAVQRSTQP